MSKSIRLGSLVVAAALLGILGVASSALAYQTGFGQPQLVSVADSSTSQCGGSDSNALITRPYYPQYPQINLEQGLEGLSLVTFTMSLDGNVSDVNLAGTSGNRLFDRAAVEAVKRSHFAPAVRSCAKISGVYGIRVVFAAGPAPDWTDLMLSGNAPGRRLIK